MDMTPELLTTLLENATSLGISLFALWVVSKKLWKSQDDHVAAYKERISKLETHAVDCNKDRDDLHKRQAELQTRVIDSLTALTNNRTS